MLAEQGTKKLKIQEEQLELLGERRYNMNMILWKINKDYKLLVIPHLIMKLLLKRKVHNNIRKRKWHLIRIIHQLLKRMNSFNQI